MRGQLRNHNRVASARLNRVSTGSAHETLRKLREPAVGGESRIQSVCFLVAAVWFCGTSELKPAKALAKAGTPPRLTCRVLLNASCT